MITDEMILQAVRNCCGTDEIEVDTELFESGLLDSYGFILLLTELDEMGVSIEPTEIGIESFSDVRKIIEAVKQYS